MHITTIFITDAHQRQTHLDFVFWTLLLSSHRGLRNGDFDWSVSDYRWEFHTHWSLEYWMSATEQVRFAESYYSDILQWEVNIFCSKKTKKTKTGLILKLPGLDQILLQISAMYVWNCGTISDDSLISSGWSNWTGRHTSRAQCKVFVTFFSSS